MSSMNGLICLLSTSAQTVAYVLLLYYLAEWIYCNAEEEWGEAISLKNASSDLHIRNLHVTIGMFQCNVHFPIFHLVGKEVFDGGIDFVEI